MEAIIDAARRHFDSVQARAPWPSHPNPSPGPSPNSVQVHPNPTPTPTPNPHADVDANADQVQAAVAGALRNLSELDEVAADIASLGGIETPSEP